MYRPIERTNQFAKWLLANWYGLGWILGAGLSVPLVLPMDETWLTRLLLIAGMGLIVGPFLVLLTIACLLLLQLLALPLVQAWYLATTFTAFIRNQLKA